MRPSPSGPQAADDTFLFSGENFAHFRDMRVKVIDLLHLEQVKNLGCCRKCRDCCAGFCAHGWFFTICCGYVVLSSLPRTITILDFILSLVFFFSHPDGGVLKTLGRNFAHFEFTSSSIDIVFISLFRSIVLYFCFAFKYQKEGYVRNVQLALVLAISSSIYLLVKTAVADKSWIQHMAFFILLFVWIELGLFLLVRRRRIRMRPFISEPQTYEYKALEGIVYVPNPMTPSRDTDKEKSETVSEPSEEDAPVKAKISMATIPINDSNYQQSESSFLVSSLSSQPSMSIQEHDFRDYELPLRLKDSEFVMIGDVSVHCCIERGEDIDGPWVVLLHGFGGGIFSWRRSFDYLLPHVAGILAFDRPGFGLTQRLPEGKVVADGISPYSNQFHLLTLKTLMEDNDISSAVLVGHSTGASFACHFAREYPLMVQGLVLVAPSTGIPTFVRSILKMKLGKTIMLNLVKSDIGQVTIQRSWHDPSKIPAEVTDAYRACLKLPMWGDALLAMSRIEVPFSLNDALPDIDVPVLMLHGDDDKLIMYPESKRISERFPTPAELIKVRHCGHMPHEELPEVFADHVCRFLERFKSDDPDVRGPSMPLITDTPSETNQPQLVDMVLSNSSNAVATDSLLPQQNEV